LNRLRLGRPAESVECQTESQAGDKDANHQPHALAGHEAAGQHARALQDPDRADQDGDHTGDKTPDSHRPTLRERVLSFQFERVLATPPPPPPPHTGGEGSPPAPPTSGGGTL